MERKSRRFAVRFGLATLFFALTIASLLLAYATSIVRERRKALDEHQRDVGGFYVKTDDLRSELAGVPNYPAELLPDGSIPWWRELLGDEAIETIFFPVEREPTSEEKERLARLFPEADVLQQQYPPGVAF